MESRELLRLGGSSEGAQPIKDLEAYEIFEEFSAFEAAHLWFELEPNLTWGYVPPCHVEKMIKTIFGGGKDTFGSARHTFIVTRSQLKELAKKLGTKPKFLFPEAGDPARWNELNTPKKDSYQELIRILSKMPPIDLKDKDTVGVICKRIEHLKNEESNPPNLSEATIRKILDEIEPSRPSNRKRRAIKTK